MYNDVQWIMLSIMPESLSDLSAYIHTNGSKLFLYAQPIYTLCTHGYYATEDTICPRVPVHFIVRGAIQRWTRLLRHKVTTLGMSFQDIIFAIYKIFT